MSNSSGSSPECSAVSRTDNDIVGYLIKLTNRGVIEWKQDAIDQRDPVKRWRTNIDAVEITVEGMTIKVGKYSLDSGITTASLIASIKEPAYKLEKKLKFKAQLLNKLKEMSE